MEFLLYNNLLLLLNNEDVYLRSIKRLRKYKYLKQMPKPQIKEIIGEDRQFGGNELFIDLVPRSCWFTSIRSSIVKSDWDRLRKYIFTRADNKCECCASTENLEGHQRWDYDSGTKIQKLMRIVALCKKCHFSTHMGRAEVIGMGDQAKEYLKNVRKWSEEEFKAHRTEAFELWRQRNKTNWKLDLSFVTQNGLELTRQMKERLRKQEQGTN